MAAARGRVAARFASRIWFTKAEAFDACQALADAGRVLVRWGRSAEAGALGDLFELFEERLSDHADLPPIKFTVGGRLADEPPGVSRGHARTKRPEMTDDYRKEAGAIAELSPRQYAVTQESATEPAFDNEFWDKEEAGIYVDIVSGEPLFASLKKFDSGCGWPSFTIPLEPANVVEREDRTHGMLRTEVRSKHGDSHLGHVFDDGPTEAGGLRYCINSAALRFVPYADLEAEGYGQYKRVFDGPKDQEEVAR